MEVNEIETRISIEEINKAKSWLFEKINKTHKPLVRLTKKKERQHILPISKMKEGTLLQILCPLKE